MTMFASCLCSNSIALVRRQLEQRVQRWVLKRLRGVGMVQHLLERFLQLQRARDLPHRPGVRPLVT
jgi:hypothetical protein